MGKAAKSGTRISLLARLAQSGEPDQAAWADFVDQYGRKIYQWCLHWKLQPADAQDVVQSVLLKLATRMKEFRYDPSRSFRAWLKTVTHHAWKDFADSRAMPTGTDDQLQSLAAREDLVQQLEEEYDHELLQQAMEIVRLRAAPHNWKAFCLTALEGVPAEEAARRLQMKIARVYGARSNIQQRLQEEVQRLEEAQDLALALQAKAGAV
jgi:RNA polymerase sigma-70 factor (ECF subfamily)